MTPAATHSLQLACSECGRESLTPAPGCEHCGGLLAFELTVPRDFDPAAFRATLAERRASTAAIDRSGVWRFRDLLPPFALESIVTLRENDVPLYRAHRGAVYAGVRAVEYLHLGMNPTASFKDGGMTVAISDACARGARVAVCASTGNTSASMAAYAARAGMTAAVLVPDGQISAAKLAQTLDYGAHVIAIDGDFDRALEVVRGLDAQTFAIVNSVNPYRIEGQKCTAFALLEQRGWRVPDWIVLPGGNLGNSSAIGKGLRELLALGLIDRLPRLAVIQAEGAAPFARAFELGLALEPVVAKTTATAIKIGAPASWRKALREVNESRGIVIHVHDDAIADARAVIGADGIGCEPASAASLAGLRELRRRNEISESDDVVLILTGHLLKDTGYATEYHTGDHQFSNRIQRAGDGAAVRTHLAALADRE